MVKLIHKLINKFFTLTAFFSASCLAVNYAPIHICERTDTLEGLCISILQSVFFLAISAASILLLLDFFAINIKPVQRKNWIIFAAIGILPILPIVGIALMGAAYYLFYLLALALFTLKNIF